MKMINLFLVLSVAVSASSWACDYREEIEQVLDVSTSSSLAIEAAAGDLEIVRGKARDQVIISATICASSEALKNAASLDIETGSNPRVAVVLPETKSGWNWMNREYVNMDLVFEVPENLSLSVRDSSGDIQISDTGPIHLTDSSGDIEIEGVVGAIVLSDSSGDIDLRDIQGDVKIERDSSGDMEGRNISGNVLVERDSSGDIRFRDVTSNVVVERDSSGDIEARSVGGDFFVLRDGSGGISYSDVLGDVQLPEGK